MPYQTEIQRDKVPYNTSAAFCLRHTAKSQAQHFNWNSRQSLLLVAKHSLQ